MTWAGQGTDEAGVPHRRRGERPRQAPRRLRTAPTAVAVVAAMLLAGCQLTSPIQTAQPYEPADGVSVDLGTVVIRDLLVVASAKGTAGVLSGLIVNKGDAPVTVSIGAADGTPVTAQVGPRSATRLSGGTGTPAAPLANVASDPGGMVELNVNTPAGGTDQVTVPVLPPTGYYSTLTAAPTAPAG